MKSYPKKAYIGGDQIFCPHCAPDGALGPFGASQGEWWPEPQRCAACDIPLRLPLEPGAIERFVRMFAKYGGIANLEVLESYGLDPEAAADGIVAPMPAPDPRG
jgi:hypothetical protein